MYVCRNCAHMENNRAIAYCPRCGVQMQQPKDAGLEVLYKVRKAQEDQRNRDKEILNDWLDDAWVGIKLLCKCIATAVLLCVLIWAVTQ